jgi:hypothetical protein
MNTEAKPSVRRDALVATIALGALGLLWIVFRLYWQGLLLLVAASVVACLGVGLARRQPRAGAPAPPQKPARANAPRRTKKRRRRK